MSQMETTETMSSDFLEHYGRKGMKWGQHIFGDESPSATFKKGSSTKEAKTSNQRTEYGTYKLGKITGSTTQADFDKIAEEYMAKNPKARSLFISYTTSDGVEHTASYAWNAKTGKAEFVTTITNVSSTGSVVTPQESKEIREKEAEEKAKSGERFESKAEKYSEYDANTPQSTFDKVAQKYYESHPTVKTFLIMVKNDKGQDVTLYYSWDDKTKKAKYDGRSTSMSTTGTFKHVDDSDFLEHYGRLGMKWYQHIYGDYQSKAKYAEKAGGSSKQSKKDQRAEKKAAKKAEKVAKKEASAAKKAAREEARRKARIEQIKSDPSLLYKHRKEFTREEIDEAMKTFEWEKKLRGYSLSKMDDGAEFVNKLVKTGGNLIAAYNTAARVYNTVNPEDRVPYVEGVDSNKNKKKKKDKDKEQKS